MDDKDNFFEKANEELKKIINGAKSKYVEKGIKEKKTVVLKKTQIDGLLKIRELLKKNIDNAYEISMKTPLPEPEVAKDLRVCLNILDKILENKGKRKKKRKRKGEGREKNE